MSPPVLMPFLRPLPLPRPSFVRQFLRRISATSTTTPAADVTAAPPSSPSPAAAAESLEPLTYHVHRTPSQQLPVYHLAKRGGNLHQTRVRKIDGNLADLRTDLQKALNLEDSHIAVNELTRHIVIKGWKKHEVARFLEAKHF